MDIRAPHSVRSEICTSSCTSATVRDTAVPRDGRPATPDCRLIGDGWRSPLSARIVRGGLTGTSDLLSFGNRYAEHQSPHSGGHRRPRRSPGYPGFCRRRSATPTCSAPATRIPTTSATVVVPPAFHESVVDAALAHDMHVISEKPIADTLEASVRIADKVQRAGKKMGVTMSHRFDQDKTTLRHELRSSRPRRIDYLVCRFTCGLRNFGDWGAHFRHTMQEALMIEGAVHHLDIIADMPGRSATPSTRRPGTPRGVSTAVVRRVAPRCDPHAKRCGICSSATRAVEHLSEQSGGSGGSDQSTSRRACIGFVCRGGNRAGSGGYSSI